MSWRPPSESHILQTIDATWPAARYVNEGPFVLRLGLGGGQRVSAASANVLANSREICNAENKMQDWAQPRLFMISTKDKSLDLDLAARGYFVKDPVTMFASSIETLTQQDKNTQGIIRSDSALAVMKETWAESRFEAGRFAVMARCQAPKTYLLCRAEDRVVGAAFVAINGKTAMLHALEILPTFRHKGLGRAMTTAAAIWAAEQGAETFSIVAVSENAAACGLYRHLGMLEVGHYHYRKKD